VSSTPIAIVGLASLLPGSDDLQGFWQSLLEARDCFSDVPEQHWRIEDYFDPKPRAKDKTYGKRGGFIPHQPFDALGFGLPPSTLPSTDVAQLLALLIAQRCLTDADHGTPGRFDRKRTACILGAAATTQLVAHMSGRMARPMWKQGLRNLGMDESLLDKACDAIADQFVPWQESTFPGLLGNVIAGRVANRFDLGGTNCALDAACASSLAALSMAINELRSGQADTVLTGGVDALNDVLMFLCFSQTPALSLTGDCRPFSDQADGTMLGEGVAMLALRRLEDAERDGHKIYAVIRGLGSSSDGRAKSVYAPRSQGQAMALRRAYENAGYGPETVELVEAHGTGTVAGDAAEFGGLTEVFGPARPDEHQWCALGSVKSQIGHTKAAAGAASLVKVALALHHRTLPPTIKVARPNPAMKLDESPFYLNTTVRPWFSRTGQARRGSVSSFGFGGSNFHVTLEEYRGAHAAARLDGSPVHLWLLGDSSVEAMRARLATLPGQVTSAAALANAARESHTSFDPGAAVRVALLVDHREGLSGACDEASALLTGTAAHARGTHCVVSTGPAASASSVAFLFPGQGSQYVQMGRDLAIAFPEAFAAWEAADAAVPADGTMPAIGDVVFPRTAFDEASLQRHEQQLRATSQAQPALAAASLAQLALLKRLGLTPAAVAGHSFGELVALHTAGVFDATTLVQLARARGQAMESCATAGEGSLGSMLAVAADAATVRAVLDEHGDASLVLANDNHPKQAVLSGPVDSLKRIEARLSARGLSFQPLKVAAAFHSPLVAPAASAFGAAVRARRFGSPTLPVIGNATAEPYPTGAKAVQTQLADQLAQPVRFRESLDALYAQGCRVFVEVGAGAVLTGLTSRCLKGRDHVALSLDTPGTHGLRSFWRGLGELAVLGLRLDFAALHASTGAWTPAPLPPTGPAVVSVGGANLGKPYPPPAGQPPVRPSQRVMEVPLGSAGAVAPSSAGAVSPAVPSAGAPAPMPGAPSVVSSSVSASRVPTMSDHTVPSVPVVLRPAEGASPILEAQRLTQQALLESFSMTLRGLGGSALPVAPAALAAAPVMYAPAPVMQAAPVYAPPAAPVYAPAPMPVAAPVAMPVPAPVPVAVAPPAPVMAAPAPVAAPAPAPVSAPASAPAPAAQGGGSSSTVLAIIAEKTGYPVDALSPEMDLEADLGIDSIKRVEILGAVNDRVPGLDASKVSPADVRRVSDLLALLGGAPADPQQAAAR
jgi:polyketide-type polyunsaturated fatty acid synthase PfaA